MAENTVSGVNRVDVQNALAAMQQAQQAQLASSPRQQTVAKPKETIIKPRQVEASNKPVEASAKQVEASSKSEENILDSIREERLPIGKDTSLKFLVDAEKHEVTIMIVDRATDKVIATIPSDAIKNLSPGELLNYPI